MLSVNRKSHVMGHVMTLRIFGAPKSCAFGEVTKRYLINLTPWVGLIVIVTWGGDLRSLWKWVSLRWPKIRESNKEKGKLTLQSFKRRYQLIVRPKAIKSIEELLYCLSFYINFESFNLCSSRPINIMMIGAFDLMVDCLIRWDWLSLPLLLIWLLSVWSIPKAIHFTYELHAQVISVAIETCYCSHRSDFHRSDLFLRQPTSFMNYTLCFYLLSEPWFSYHCWTI